MVLACVLVLKQSARSQPSCGADSVSGVGVGFHPVFESLFSSPSRCRSSQGSLEGRDIQAAEAVEESNSVLSEAIDHSDILAYLSGARSSSRQTQRTPDRSVW